MITPGGRDPGPPARAWHAVAAASALAAVVVLTVYPTAMFIAAGGLAAGAAAMAEREALLRGRVSDVGGLLTTVLAVSFVMILVLALVDSHRR